MAIVIFNIIQAPMADVAGSMAAGDGVPAPPPPPVFGGNDNVDSADTWE